MDYTQNITETEDGLLPDEYKSNQDIIAPFSFIIMLFITLAVSIATLPGANYVVIGVGVICATGYLMGSIGYGFVFPTELRFFAAFYIWAFMGIFIMTLPELFFQQLFTLTQIGVMAGIIIHFSSNTKTVRYFFIALLVGAAIVALSGYLSGDYKRAESEGERVSGIALNANAFAMALVYATLVLLGLFRGSISKLFKALCIAGITVIAPFIIASGSRKGFIMFVAVITLWFLFSYSRDLIRKPLTTLFLCVLLVAGGAVFFSKLAGTTMETRLMELQEASHGGLGGSSISTRRAMIEKGLYLVSRHPIFGVGLNHYRVYSGEGTYAHNNYIELSANTGIPGVVFYYLIFLMLWLRLRRLGKLPLQISQRAIIDIGKIFLFIKVVVDVSLVSYTDKTVWILTAIFIGWSYHLEQDIKNSVTFENVSYEDTLLEAGKF